MDSNKPNIIELYRSDTEGCSDTTNALKTYRYTKN